MYNQSPERAEYETGQMVMIKYKTDKAPEAKAMIKRYFVPVDEELGRNSGIGYQWMQTFTRQQGQETATKLLKQFEELIERTTTALVRQTD